MAARVGAPGVGVRVPGMTPVSSGHPVPQRAMTRIEQLRAAWAKSEPNWEHHAWALAVELRRVLDSDTEGRAMAGAQLALDEFHAAAEAFIAAGNAWSDHLGVGDAAQ